MTRRAASSESGFSLIETLVAVAIVGVTFVVFVAGMGTSFLATAAHRKQSVADAGIRNFAEAVKAAPFSSDCANVAAIYGSAYSPPPPERRSSAASSVNVTSHVAPSITPGFASTELLAFYALAGGPTLTLPAPPMAFGWNAASNSGTAANKVTVGFVDQLLAAKTATGTRTATSSTAVSSVAQVVSIRPASATPIVRRGVSTVATPPSGGTGLALAAPAATVIGDSLIAQVAVRGANTNVSPPAGWTLVNAKTSGTVTSLLYERTARVAGTVVHNWTFSAVTEAAGGIVSYGGASKAYNASVTAVKWWDGTAFTTTCPAPESNSAQLVSLLLQSTDLKATQRIDVVKRCHERPTPYEPCLDAP